MNETCRTRCLLAATLTMLAIPAPIPAAPSESVVEFVYVEVVEDETDDDVGPVERARTTIEAFRAFVETTDGDTLDDRRDRFESVDDVLEAIETLSEEHPAEAARALRLWVEWARTEPDAWLVHESVRIGLWTLDELDGLVEPLAEHRSPSIRELVAWNVDPDDRGDLYLRRLAAETDPHVRARLLMASPDDDRIAAAVATACRDDLDSTVPALARSAADGLEELDRPDLDGRIADRLARATAPARGALLRALAESGTVLGPATASEVVAQWTCGDDPCLRPSILRILLARDLPLDPWTLEDLLWDDDAEVVALATHALAARPEGDAAIVARATVGPTSHRLPAVRMLARMPEPSAEDAIFDLMAASQPDEIRQVALAALRSRWIVHLAARARDRREGVVGPSPDDGAVERWTERLRSVAAAAEASSTFGEEATSMLADLDRDRVEIVTSCGGYRAAATDIAAVRRPADAGTLPCRRQPGSALPPPGGPRWAEGSTLLAVDRFDDGSEVWLRVTAARDHRFGEPWCWIPAAAVEAIPSACPDTLADARISDDEFDHPIERVDTGPFRALVEAGVFEVLERAGRIAAVRFRREALRVEHLPWLVAAGPWNDTPVGRPVGEAVP